MEISLTQNKIYLLFALAESGGFINQIQDGIKKRTGKSLSRPAISTNLRSLRLDKLIADTYSYERLRSPRGQKYYEITEKGLEQVETILIAINAFEVKLLS